jgi:hypothetical protein
MEVVVVFFFFSNIKKVMIISYRCFCYRNTTIEEGDNNNNYCSFLFFYNITIKEIESALLLPSSFQTQKKGNVIIVFLL